MAIVGLVIRAKVIIAWANTGNSKVLEYDSNVYAMIGAMFQLGSDRAPVVFVCYTTDSDMGHSLDLKVGDFSLSILWVLRAMIQVGCSSFLSSHFIRPLLFQFGYCFL